MHNGKKKRGHTCFGKCRAILLHELLAGRDTRSLRTTLILAWNTSRCPHTPSPIAAQGSIEDGTVVLEKLERIAAACRPECAWRAPIIRNGRLSGDVRWYVLPREEVNGDTRVVPKHCQGKVSISNARYVLMSGDLQNKNVLAKTPPPFWLNGAPNELV